MRPPECDTRISDRDSDYRCWDTMPGTRPTTRANQPQSMMPGALPTSTYLQCYLGIRPDNHPLSQNLDVR